MNIVFQTNFLSGREPFLRISVLALQARLAIRKYITREDWPQKSAKGAEGKRIRMSEKQDFPSASSSFASFAHFCG